jgi:hypothetical protein
MPVKSKLQYKEQINFIDTLMTKLKKDLNKGMSHFSSNDIYYGIPGHHRMQNDITRIRRELNILSKMLNPYGDE